MSEVVIEKFGKGGIVRLQGRLDAITTPPIEQQLITAIRKGTTPLFLDFSKVDYLSSAGMRMIISLNKTLQAKGEELTVFNIRKEIAQILKMTGFDQMVHSVETEEEALKKI